MSETGVGLSELPDGWEVRTLGEITDIFKGGTPKRNVEKYFQGNMHGQYRPISPNYGEVYK